MPYTKFAIQPYNPHHSVLNHQELTFRGGRFISSWFRTVWYGRPVPNGHILNDLDLFQQFTKTWRSKRSECKYAILNLE